MSTHEATPSEMQALVELVDVKMEEDTFYLSTTVQYVELVDLDMIDVNSEGDVPIVTHNDATGLHQDVLIENCCIACDKATPNLPVGYICMKCANEVIFG